MAAAAQPMLAAVVVLGALGTVFLVLAISVKAYANGVSRVAALCLLCLHSEPPRYGVRGTEEGGDEGADEGILELGFRNFVQREGGVGVPGFLLRSALRALEAEGLVAPGIWESDLFGSQRVWRLTERGRLEARLLFGGEWDEWDELKNRDDRDLQDRQESRP